MTNQQWKLGTKNYLKNTLDGNITADSASIILVSSTGFQYPGVVVIDRTDAGNTDTPNSREYVSFTGITDNTLTGCSRGLAGSIAQAHSDGAVVEETWSVSHWNDFYGIFTESHSSTGHILAQSMATLADVRISGRLNASGASITSSTVIVQDKINTEGATTHGIFGGVNIQWQVNGNLSGATTGVGKPITMIDNGNWQFFAATTRTAASGATLILDINKQGTSIFEDTTRLMIPQNGTFVSSASINTKAFVPTNTFTVDVDSDGMYPADLTIIGRAK